MRPDNKTLVKNIFHDVFENPNVTKEVCEKYFSPSYVQYVDGKKLNYKNFVQHILNLKSTLSQIKITFKHIVAENDKVSTVHVVEGVKKNGVIIKAQVNALFQIKDQKVILCDELTHLVLGEKADTDIGST